MTNISSLLCLDEEKIYSKSTAALRITKYLSGGFQFFFIFLLVPTFIRDSIYIFIARNRYQFFGTKTECKLLKEEWTKRFLDIS